MVQTTNIPVVIAHFGNQPEYLKYALEAAAQWNQDVIFIGDDGNKNAWANHWSISGVTIPKWVEFENSYIKLSNYPEHYEKAILFRLFVMDYWLQTAAVNGAFLIDIAILNENGTEGRRGTAPIFSSEKFLFENQVGLL